MAASFIGVEVSESASTTSLDCAFHASTAVDDILVAFVFRNDNNGVIDIPSGWSEDANAQISDNFDNDVRGTTLTKVATSGDVSAGTVTITHTHTAEAMSVHIVTVRGINTGDIYDVTPIASHYATPDNDSTPDIPPITTVNNGAFVLTFWGLADSDVSSCTEPSGFTAADITTLIGSSFALRHSYSAYQIVSTATAITGEWNATTAGSPEGYTATIALKPAVAGGGTILPFIQAYYRGLN